LVNIRDFTPGDIPALTAAIDADQFHKGEWKVEHFYYRYIDGLPSKVLEDKAGPVAFLLYSSGDDDQMHMRVSCVWADTDARRNARAMLQAIPMVALVAREHHFAGLVIETKHDKLAAFLTRAFGMVQTGNDYFLTFDRRP
jgi:hypothetical protein